MIAAAESAGVQLMVGESYVFHGPHRLARRLIDRGEIGTVVQIRQTKGPWVFTEAEQRRLGGRGHDVPWRFDPEKSGGGDFPWMMDHAPHFFATARLFAKRRIRTVSALARDHGYGGLLKIWYCRGNWFAQVLFRSCGWKISLSF